VKPSQLYESLTGILGGSGTPIAAAAATPGEDLARRLPLRLLVVEDNPVNQQLVLLLLEKIGYRADVAGNGVEALDALERQPYDAVLMDVEMPEMDGLEATRRIHERWASERPHIVAVTANALPGEREKCIQAGMDDYIVKPIRLDELSAALTRVVPRGDSSAAQPAVDVAVIDKLAASLGPQGRASVDALIGNIPRPRVRADDDALERPAGQRVRGRAARGPCAEVERGDVRRDPPRRPEPGARGRREGRVARRAGRAPDEHRGRTRARDRRARGHPRGAAFMSDGASVLVVDDDPVTRQMLSGTLDDRGHRVTTAEDGRRALDLLRSERFDVVLLDVLMPQLNGYEVLEQMKADEDLRHIPVVMVDLGRRDRERRPVYRARRRRLSLEADRPRSC
jgi:CheY-like chemotaxis protein